MNQVIKDAIYSNGNSKHVEYMSKVGGMSEIEAEILRMIHDGRTDLFIQTELNMSKNTYTRIEETVRRKLLIAVFHCIDYTMKNEI